MQVIDFNKKKKERDDKKLDLLAGLVVLEETLKKLQLNKSDSLKSIKKEIKNTIKELSRQYNGNSTKWLIR